MQKANDKKEILEVLSQISNQKISPQQALEKLQTIPFQDLGYANIDYHRVFRQGKNEVIYGQSKTAKQIFGIVSDMIQKGLKDILITRISKEKFDFVSSNLNSNKINVSVKYYNDAKIAAVNSISCKKLLGCAAVVCAGTSDINVCEEAAVTLEILGSKVERLYDVGVSGLHRLLSKKEILLKARVIVAVAGMEGALPSVIGGLVSCPIIAVPTSVGYGTNLGGISALLAMLNSCSNGVSVVNIDNGFGAGFIADRINKMETAE
jgi:NCAIR mutase (PurE)-related protein